MRINRALLAAAIVGLTTANASAQPRPGTSLKLARAPLVRGGIEGVVSDEHGGPLAGAMVSALGATSALALTDVHGRFVIEPLPPGEYVLRVHMPGFASTRRDAVRVGTTASVVDRIQLHRVDGSEAHPVLAAGLGPSGSETIEEGGPDHPHSDTAWRLRHVKRSILKQNGEVVQGTDAAADGAVADAPAATVASLFGRAFDNAGFASGLADSAFSGQVNLLTTSAFGQGQMFTGDFLPRGVAYLEIGAPVASGRWDVRAAMNSMGQTDASAWVVAGTYSSHAAGHAYSAGLSYGLQQFQGSRVHAPGLQPTSDPSRGVGELFASDTWTIAPVLTLELGARYARYDYLAQPALTSPRAAVIVTPIKGTRITARAAQRMLAPGAEEFLASPEAGPWLPPERTFASLTGDDFSVERSRFVEVGVEHDLGDAYVIGVRRFHERVGDQLMALFGLASPGLESPGHYYVANAGDFAADGWAVRVTATPLPRVRGTIDYSVAHASWLSRGDLAAIAIWAPDAIRADREAVHDLTTSLETSIPATLTRVFVLYQLNDAVVRPSDAGRGMADARFDVQVNQALPFMPLRNARWEALVGVRNLFRETVDSGSTYDELLVIHPPTRFVGGVLVKF